MVRPGFKKGFKLDAIALKDMDVKDRLQAMEVLWNSFLDKESEVETPDWHRDILEERKRRIKSGKAEFVSLKQLKASRKS